MEKGSKEINNKYFKVNLIFIQEIFIMDKEVDREN